MAILPTCVYHDVFGEQRGGPEPPGAVLAHVRAHRAVRHQVTA